MSSSPIPDRIQNLFEPSASEERPVSNLPDTQGWSWSCNADGLYRFCSADVNKHLQIEADRFIGQPVSSFQVHPISIQLIKEALQQSDYPVELEILFGNGSGQWVAVRMHIFARAPIEDVIPGWYGFNLLLAPAEESSNRPEVDRAIFLIRQGRPMEARHMLRAVIDKTPEDETAWLWLASTFEEDTLRLEIMEDYLKINPGSKTVKQVMTGLRERVMSQATEKARLAAAEILASKTPAASLHSNAPTLQLQSAPGEKQAVLSLSGQKESHPLPQQTENEEAGSESRIELEEIQSEPQSVTEEGNDERKRLLWALIIIGATITAAVLYVVMK